VFAFCVRAGRGIDATFANQAVTWLRNGLEQFGIGGKTSAGYGWFDCSKAIQDLGVQRLEDDRQARRRRQESEERTRHQAEAIAKAAQAKRATEGMDDDQKADFEVAQLTEAQFGGRLENFLQRDSREQHAMVRALRLNPDAPNSRGRFWDSLKEKACKGGKPARIEQVIRELSKKMNLGRMP
jgi:hypothetical protein